MIKGTIEFPLKKGNKKMAYLLISHIKLHINGFLKNKILIILYENNFCNILYVIK